MKKLTAIVVSVLLLVSIAGCAQSKSKASAGSTTTPNPTQAQLLTKEQAQSIALEHAGLTAGEVTRLRVEYEVDDRIPQYEVDFRQGDYDFDYTIHAETGAVLEWDKEYDPVDATPVTSSPTTAPTTSAPVEPEPEPEPTPVPLTQPQAEAIALEHAKVTEVSNLVTRYEIDDGVPQYEIEFRKDDYEYDYTIHAESGKILEWDKEYDPPKTTPTEPKPTEPEPERLTKEQIKAIALEHAGLNADQVRGLEIEYDVDDGVPEYSVEFTCDGWEYDYEIHAETGKILEWDKDKD